MEIRNNKNGYIKRENTHYEHNLIKDMTDSIKMCQTIFCLNVGFCIIAAGAFLKKNFYQ